MIESGEVSRSLRYCNAGTERRELAPVLSRVGSALQYRRDRLTSPLSFMPRKLCNRSRKLENDCMLNAAGLSKGQNCASDWHNMI